MKRNWDLKVENKKIVLKRPVVDDFMFYLVFTPYDGEHENCVYWVSPIIYVSDTTAYIAKTRLLYRAFKSENLESAIRFVEERIDSLVNSDNVTDDDDFRYWFNGYEDALAWTVYPMPNKMKAIKFSSRYKGESIDLVFVLSVEDIENPPIATLKNGLAINCGFKKLKEAEDKEE